METVHRLEEEAFNQDTHGNQNLKLGMEVMLFLWPVGREGVWGGVLNLNPNLVSDVPMISHCVSGKRASRTLPVGSACPVPPAGWPSPTGLCSLSQANSSTSVTF